MTISTVKSAVSAEYLTDDLDYHQLFNVLPDRYIVMKADDPDFTIIGENQAHADVAMVRTGDIMGRPILDAFPDTSPAYKRTGVSALIESIRLVVKTGVPDTMSLLRFDLRSPDGTIVDRYWRVTHYPVFGPVGAKSSRKQVIAVFQATEDITETVMAKRKRDRSEQQLNEALSAGLVGTWLWDMASNLVTGDVNMAKMFGIDSEQAAAGVPREVLTNTVFSEDRERVQTEIAAAIADKTIFESEYRTIGTNGVLHWVIGRGRIEIDDEGIPVSFPGVLIDITERKYAEDNVKLLARTGELLTGARDYKKSLQDIGHLMVTDSRFANWCSIEMLDDDGVLQQTVVAHHDPAKVAWAKELRIAQGPPDLDNNGIGQVLRSGEAVFYPEITPEMIETESSTPDEIALLKKLDLHSIIIVPIKIRDQTVGAMSLIATSQERTYTTSDLETATALSGRIHLALTTAKLYEEAQSELEQRRQLEEKLRIANEELEHRVDVRTSELEESNLSLHRSNQELQDFAYVASHDLQEPLRKIQAFGDLLETEYADKLGDGVDYLARMRNAAARMSGLIQDILSFSRVTTKAREFQSVKLATVAHEVISDLEVRIKETGAVIDIASLPTIHADAMQMRQLFQNLLANAIKFHKPNVAPRISVSATTVAAPNGLKACQIDFKDNGLGFDPKYLDRIFAVFQRLHNRENYEGTGIGLAVCRKIVERHGGSITATSSPGQGATFIVTLPLRHKKGETLS